MNSDVHELEHAQQDVEELSRNGMGFAGGMLLAVGGVASWIALAREDLPPLMLLAFSLVAATGALALSWRWRRPLASQIVLAVGPSLSLAIALHTSPGPEVPLFAVLPVVLNSAVRPLSGGIAAALCSLALMLTGREHTTFLPTLALVWLTAAAEWASSRGLRTALEWAWNSQRHANNLVARLRSNQGELNRTIAALTEATRRLQRIGYELAIARVNADRLRELKSRFAANISHELRTPLNLIMGFSETMYVTPDVYGDVDWTPELRQDIRRIYQSSRQLSELVDDVLDLSRVDGGEMPIRKGWVDLREVIEDALALVQGLLRGRALEMRADLPCQDILVNVDATRIRQVLVNLLNNAARFTEHGTISVSTETTEDEIIVTVADTGIGIPQDELGRIFDEYHQVDMSLRTAKDGVGLGLAISRRFVELHGGRMWAESKVGQGSSFRFALPRGESTARTRLMSTPRSAPRAVERPYVLVVDEDPQVSALLERHIPHLDFRQAQDNALLETEWPGTRPMAIIVNEVPGAAHHAKRGDSLPPTVPIITCSIPNQRWAAEIAGANACILKPVSRDQLGRLLDQYPSAQRLLIVDDDPGFVQLMARYVESLRPRLLVLSAYDGERALQLLRAHKPDLVLLDLVMPGMDGFAFMEAVRRDPRLAETPVAIITATELAMSAMGRQRGRVQVARSEGFTLSETLGYIEALLGAIDLAPTPHDSTAQPATLGD